MNKYLKYSALTCAAIVALGGFISPFLGEPLGIIVVPFAAIFTYLVSRQ